MSGLEAFRERMAKLRQLRERTGAPMSACDEALKACDGDVDAAAEHPATRRTRGYDGDPRHRCREDCPPWAFRWVRRSGCMLCSTHCRRHLDERWTSDTLIRQLFDLDDASIRDGVLSICDWDAPWAIRFLLAAGARAVAPHV